MRTRASFLHRLALLLLLGLMSPAMMAAEEPNAPAPTPAIQGGDPISDRWLQRIEEQLWPPAKCLPDCVHIAAAQVSAGGGSGRLMLDVHVQTGTFLLRLPFSSGWAPWSPRSTPAT